MGSAFPVSVRHPVSDPIVPPSVDFQWAGAQARAQSAREAAADHRQAAAADSTADASDLLELQFQGLNARLEMEAVFGEGLLSL